MRKQIYSHLDIIDLKVANLGNFKQFDSLKLQLEIRNNQNFIDLANNTIRLKIYRQKDKKMFLQTDGITIKNNIVTIELKSSALSLDGNVYCEMEIKDPNGSISTATFQLVVKESINPEGLEIPSEDKGILNQLLSTKYDDVTYENNILNFYADKKKIKSVEIISAPITRNNEIWRPSVNSEGLISWEKSTSLEVPIPQNIKGPKGDVGLTGSQGPRGPKGDKGEVGPQGLRGDKGDKGVNGSNGTNGTNGTNGKSAYEVWLDSGNIGTEQDFILSLKGQKGDVGNIGPQGLKGDKGDVGLTGQQGSRGEQGPKGDTGATGPQGEVGTTNYNDLLNKPDLTLYVSKEELNKSTSMQVTTTETINKLENSKDGFLNINSIKGKTIQNANNLSDIKSVGDSKKLTLISNGINLLNPINTINAYIHGGTLLHDKTTKSVYIENPSLGTYYINKGNGNRLNCSTYNTLENNSKPIEYFQEKEKITITKKCKYLAFYVSNKQTDFDNKVTISFEPIKQYVSYKEDKQEIILNEPLRSLPNGVCDEIVNNEIIRNVKKIVLNGSENYSFAGHLWDDTGKTLSIEMFLKDALSVDNESVGVRIITDKFKGYTRNDLNSNINDEGVCQGGHSSIYVLFRINKNRLENETIEAFKKWLQANPTTVYYPLKTPIKEPLKLKNMASFKNGYLRVENEIAPVINLNYPIDIGNSIQTIQKKVIEIDGIQKALLSLADRELQMASVSLLTTEIPADIKNKINEILNIWR